MWRGFPRTSLCAICLSRPRRGTRKSHRDVANSGDFRAWEKAEYGIQSTPTYILPFRRSGQYSEIGLDSLARHSSYEVGRTMLGWSSTPVQAGSGIRGFARRGLSAPDSGAANSGIYHSPDPGIHCIPKAGPCWTGERALERLPNHCQIGSQPGRVRNPTYILLFRSRQYSEIGLDSLARHSSYAFGRTALGWSSTPVQAGSGIRGFARRGQSTPRLWRCHSPLSRPGNTPKVSKG
jgi:hypothetical protein